MPPAPPVTSPATEPPTAHAGEAAHARAATSRPPLAAFLRLARPKQWTKGAFVFIGPLYGMALLDPARAFAVVAAFLAFGFASSGCYVFNDIRDRDLDRAHPRKRTRPIAAGLISVPAAARFGAALWAVAAAVTFLVPGGAANGWARELLGLTLALYVANVLAYSQWFKRVAVLDVISLSSGFVLRVLGGCAAATVVPSTWLLNCTFFVSMFLALGKRLGERRTLGPDAASARGVHAAYTDDILRMSVVVTAVACLVSYSIYVQAQAASYTLGFNLLWLTILPATYGMLRCMLMVELGASDDPTELAATDRPFQAAVLLFGVLTVALLLWVRQPH